MSSLSVTSVKTKEADPLDFWLYDFSDPSYSHALRHKSFHLPYPLKQLYYSQLKHWQAYFREAIDNILIADPTLTIPISFKPFERYLSGFKVEYYGFDNTTRPMSTGITKQYYYFRCDTIGCQAKGKSTRGKVVMEAAYAFLDNHPLKTVEGYQRYTDEMAKLAAVKDKEAEKTLKSLQTQRRFAETRVADIKELLHNEDDAVLKREYKNDLKAQLEKVKDLDGKITKLKTQRVNGNDAVVAIGDFIELFQNIANLIRKIDSMADLDFIMRKIFMNFTVTDQKVTEITQNSPFRELCLVADSAMVTSRRVELRFPG
jgi:hypothetical protein